MSDPKTLTQADIDAAVAKVTEAFQSKLDAAEGKNSGLLDDLKKAQRELRAAKDITPEAHQAEIERADKAEAKLADLDKAVKTLTTERDKAVKAADEASEAGRAFAREATLAGAVVKGNIVPHLSDAYLALVEKRAVTELKDGKWVTTIDGKDASEWVLADLTTETGKHFVQAAGNTGGGAPGGKGGAATGDNPFAKETFNMTKQAEIIRADPGRAKELANAAGVDLAA